LRIALLSNVTVEVLAEMLRDGNAVWHPPGYGAWMETALNPPPEMLSFAPDLIAVIIDRRFGDFDPAVQSLDQALLSLKTRFPNAAVIAPDISLIAMDYGDMFYDERMWKLARMPFSLSGLRELAKLFIRHKALAIDLDGTLWKGVVGEDGVDAIVPDEELQEKLLELKRRGVLLTAVSKNNPEDVEAVWTRLRMKREDFAAVSLGWENKPSRLRELARSFNLGVDSFVFVDDNVAERVEMRAVLPEVTTIGLPSQLEAYFPFAAVTAEDSHRAEMYLAEARRQSFARSVSAEEYLGKLEIQTDVHEARDDEVSRIAQLSQRANQFNTCTNRYSEDQISALKADKSNLVLSAYSRDRFGDCGLVAFVFVRMDGSAAEVVDWVMSCRVMNRRIEFTVEDALERMLSARGIKKLHAVWRRTPKNAPVMELYEQFGFTPSESGGDIKSYVKEL